MDTAFAGGLAGTLLGLLGYVAGLAVPYPGRAFSVTVLMIGVTLLAIGSPGESDLSSEAAIGTTTVTTDRSDATTDSTGTARTARSDVTTDGGRR